MAEEILDVCRKDRDFYEESGGGVTLSGGEPLAQPDFAIGLLAQLREEGIHTAMETSGYASPKVFQQVLHHVDAFLFDCKHHNLDAHQKGTGVPNGIILKNLYEAIGTGKEVVVRIPLIPGYNDAISDAEGFCSLLWPMGVRAVQLLPFHQFGEKKYDQMGVPYAFSGISSLPREDLLPFRKIFLDRGMKCIL